MDNFDFIDTLILNVSDCIVGEFVTIAKNTIKVLLWTTAQLQLKSVIDSKHDIFFYCSVACHYRFMFICFSFSGCKNKFPRPGVNSKRP